MSESKIPKRVYIQYAVDFHEVPEVVVKLLRELSNVYGVVQTACTNAAKRVDENAGYGLDAIKELDETIQKTSDRLKDAGEILSNYIDIIIANSESAKKQEKQPSDFPVAKTVKSVVKGI